MKPMVTLLSAVCTLLVNANAQALTLSVVPASTPVTLGDSVQVELRIIGLGDGTAPSLGAFDLIIGYDSAILGFDSFTFGDSLLGNQLDLTGLGSVQGVDSAVPGKLNLYEISLDLQVDLDALQASDFALGTISFSTLDYGTSGLEFVTQPIVSDADGNPLEIATAGGSVTVGAPITATPDQPHAGLLLALGALSLMACARWLSNRPTGAT